MFAEGWRALTEQRDDNYEEFDSQDQEDIQDSYLSGGPDDDDVDRWSHDAWLEQGSSADDKDDDEDDRWEREHDAWLEKSATEGDEGDEELQTFPERPQPSGQVFFSDSIGSSRADGGSVTSSAPWTRVMDEKLLENYRSGADLSFRISPKKSEKSCEKRMTRLCFEEKGIPTSEPENSIRPPAKQVTPQQSQRVIGLWRNGESLHSISSLVGCSVAAVANVLVVFRVPEPVSLDHVSYHSRADKQGPNSYKRWSPEEIETVRSQFQAGALISLIAGTIGRTSSAVVSKLIAEGLISDLDLDALTLQLPNWGTAAWNSNLTPDPWSVTDS
jgi:hypothetical protein